MTLSAEFIEAYRAKQAADAALRAAQAAYGEAWAAWSAASSLTDEQVREFAAIVEAEEAAR